MGWRIFVVPVCVLIFMTTYQNVDAQENLAQEVSAIFEQSCLICHGPHGSFTEQLIIQSSQGLIDSGVLIPGNPDNSIFYQRLIETAAEKRMPLGQPPLPPAAIETIRQWIQAGALDWNVFARTDINFITTEEMLQVIENHVQSLDTFDRAFARYFTSTHLYNAGETTETLRAYQRALSKLVNSLSWGREVTNPQPIDSEKTIFYIDLRDYEWELGTNRWAQIEQAYPYKNNFESPTQTHLHEKLMNLRQEMNCEVPFVQVDWFLATASLPPLYHDILDLPLTDRELEAELDVDVGENIINAAGKRVWRAGFNDSGVSNHNRIVERHLSRYGAYWKSYDFAGSVGSKSIFTHPLNFTHDGGEIIFNLPNGLQAYYLSDAGGNRLNAAPINIVRNPATSDPTVRNGLSCIGCHTEGMKTFEDQVRDIVEQSENPPFDKDRVLRLYVEKTVMDGLIEEDTERYRQALEATGDVFGGIEPVQRFHEAFQRPLNASHAAAAVGLETVVFLDKIRENVRLQNLGLQVLENGAMKRDAWTSNFDDVISALNTPDSPLPPTEERPELIPGESVHIPDSTLRNVIVNVLGLSANKPITTEDMAKVNHLSWEHLADRGIQDLTGVEHAMNLESLVLQGNQVSDLSPIAGLMNLRYLFLRGSPISDLSPIEGLTNLEHLALNAKILDLSPIEGLTNLKHIKLWGANQINFSVFANLKNLESLSMWHGTISNLSEITGLTGLRHLEIYDHELEDISPIAHLTGLRTLRLGGNRNITDASPVADLINLEYLDFHHDSISDLSPLAGLVNLKKLNLYDNRLISDLSSLAGLTELTRLELRRNKVSDVSTLAGLINLEYLDLRDNPIKDFSPLEALSQNTNILVGEVAIPDRNLRAAIAEALGKENTAIVSITTEEMATLERLYVDGMDISDLTGLEFATNLEVFHIDMTEAEADENLISDLSPLAGLTKLKHLGLSGKSISDLSPLTRLINLEHLLVLTTNISDLSPLAELSKLKELHFTHTPVSDLFPLAGLTNLESLRFFYAESPSLAPLKGLTRLKILSAARSRISDLSPLTGLINLEELELFEGDRISDISSLASMGKLRRLHLQHNNISDISPLASLHNLKWVHLGNNNISDISPLNGLPADTNIIWYGNPGFPRGGPKIEGPWLWAIVPGPKLDSKTDFLSQASDGAVTELQIATHGAEKGESIGESVWTIHKIPSTGKNNIGDMTNALGWATGKETVGYVLYGSILLNSPREQQTKIFVGANDGVKVWLNGQLIYKEFGPGWDPSAINYQHIVPVTLNEGVNVLLVAVDNIWGDWSGFFGFDAETEYTLIPPGIGFTFSATETTLLPGDTFTLNLNAENVTDFAGWQADIIFDSEVLEAVEVTEDDFLKAEGGDTFFQDGTIDNTTGKITALFSARISESGVSGTGTLLSVTFKAKAGGKTQVTLENFEFSSLSGAVIPSVPPDITITVGDYPAWDVNQDGRVSIVDLVLVANDLGSDAPANLQTDVNRDGVINIQDLIVVAQHLGESTAAAAPSVIAAINNGELTPAIVQAWITQAQIESDGSIAFQQGIATLERLLALFIPEETALLHNYPNPFNPETWIPYQLSEPAEVTLTIHSVNGTLVRTLALGYQPAGIYQTRTRAAYWDSRNNLGEPVASGIYFYTLTAGDFNATRKMLIRK